MVNQGRTRGWNPSRVARLVGIGALSLVVFAGSCVSRRQYMAAVNTAEGRAQTIDQYKAYLDKLEEENSALREENAGFRKTAQDAAWVNEQKKKLADLLAKWEERGGLPEGVTPVAGPQGFTGYSIAGAILFGSGRAVLTDGGKATLGKILEDLRGKTIRVHGHTDSDPIKHSSWKSNLHLSAQRALAVAEFLQARGLPYEKTRVAGFGPSEPATQIPGEKARNRRVEIFFK